VITAKGIRFKNIAEIPSQRKEETEKQNEYIGKNS
jgi:hypothetical protein